MTETRVGFLHKIASSLSSFENNDSLTLLRSYYLIRCKELTRGYGLPERHFSTKSRCPHCCLEWNKETEIKLRPSKLSKKQKQRIRSSKANKYNIDHMKKRKELLHSNELEQICTFCKHTTVTTLLKPEKQNSKMEISADKMQNMNTIENKIILKKLKAKNTKSEKKTIETNVYSNAFDVFYLNNKNNTLASSIKEAPRVIKNNKKRKDKFAGLCQQAVLASAKLKDQKNKETKLNLFLKPSL